MHAAIWMMERYKQKYEDTGDLEDKGYYEGIRDTLEIELGLCSFCERGFLRSETVCDYCGTEDNTKKEGNINENHQVTS